MNDMFHLMKKEYFPSTVEGFPLSQKQEKARSQEDGGSYMPCCRLPVSKPAVRDGAPTSLVTKPQGKKGTLNIWNLGHTHRCPSVWRTWCCFSQGLSGACSRFPWSVPGSTSLMCCFPCWLGAHSSSQVWASWKLRLKLLLLPLTLGKTSLDSGVFTTVLGNWQQVGAGVCSAPEARAGPLIGYCAPRASEGPELLGKSAGF